VKLIGAADIIDLHSEAIIRFGGINTVPHTASDCVDGRIGNAMLAEQYVSDDERVRPGLCFAGFLLFYLVKDSCFTDGNKRVGWMAAMRVLGDIGLSVEVNQDEAFDFVDAVASGKINDGRQVVLWLAERLSAPAL
jgi:prophage maintenance system killer protein